LKQCVDYWGCPFRSEEEARAAFNEMDIFKDNRISLVEFKKWWDSPKNKSRLKLDLSEKYKLSPDKIGKGQGAAFG